MLHNIAFLGNCSSGLLATYGALEMYMGKEKVILHLNFFLISSLKMCSTLLKDLL